MRSRWLSLLIFCTFTVSVFAGESAHKPAANSNALQLWNDLLAGNERFVAGVPKVKDLPAARAELLDHQSPKVIVFGCADSRVPPELLFDKSLGELFVVRSAGNFADRNGIASIEYAVEHLGTPLLVVLGHSKCGAVTAACSGAKMPTESLQALADEIVPSCRKMEPNERIDTLQLSIETNVLHSSDDLLARSEVLTAAIKEGKLTVIHAVYDLKTGTVQRLE